MLACRRARALARSSRVDEVCALPARAAARRWRRRRLRGLWWLHQPLPLAARPGRPVDRARHHAARDRRRPWVDAGVDAVAAAALRVVPLVGPGPPDPRRQLRARARHHAARACSTRWCAARRRCAAVRLIEGWTFRQVRAALAKAEQLKPTTAALSDAELMAALGAPGLQPEGRFFPDTYTYCQGLQRPRACCSAPCGRWTSSSTRPGRERAADMPLKTRRRGADPGRIVEKETGSRRRPRQDRRRVRQPAAHRHAAADRPDRDLRPGRGASTATCASATCRPTRPGTPTRAPACRRRRSRCRARRRCWPRCSRRRPRRCTSSRAATARSQFSETLAEHNRAVNRYQRGSRRQ